MPFVLFNEIIGDLKSGLSDWFFCNSLHKVFAHTLVLFGDIYSTL